jgi:hypothetical protein
MTWFPEGEFTAHRAFRAENVESFNHLPGLSEIKDMKYAILILMLSGAAYADSEKLNCKLTIRETRADGSKKVDITEVHAMDREDCKAKAKAKELDAAEGDHRKVSFGWKELP